MPKKTKKKTAKKVKSAAQKGGATRSRLSPADREYIIAQMSGLVGKPCAEKAKALDKQVEAREVLVKGAFQALLDGDSQRHDDMVAQKAKETAQWADTLVLAQVTMARLAPRLSADVGLPVLSSLRLAVERLGQVLEGLP